MTPRIHKRERNRTARPTSAATAVASLSCLVGLVAVAPLNAATAAQVTKSKSATVVQVVTRTQDSMTFTDMLATVPGRSLYVDTNAKPCKGGCLSVWPPLLMPRGTTMPQGATGLGTAKMGTRRQVTLDGRRLYTFVSDSGSSVNGENVNGFVVAQES